MATTDSITTAAPLADEACPVCTAPIGDEPECGGCGWPLSGKLILGRLTPKVRNEFDDRLSAARRRFDLTAAARASGAPWRTDLVRLDRMEALVREGPPRPGEREEVLRELEEEGKRLTAASPDSTGAPSDAADARTLRDLARAALATGPRRSPDVTLAEITASGLTATVFGRGHDGETTERAEVHTWSWAELLAGLPKDLDAALFILAGGIGQWTGPRAGTDDLVIPETLEHLAERTVLVSRVSGWPVPESLLGLLEQRLPDAESVRLPGEAPPPDTLRHADGFTAAAWEQDADAMRLVGGGADGSVRVWRLWDPEPVAVRSLHQGRVTAVDLADEGRSVVSGGKDGAVRLWSFGGSGRARTLAWHQGWVDAVRIRAGVVFSLGDDGIRRSTLFAEPDDAAAPFPLRVAWSSAAARLAVTSDARILVVGGAVEAVVWDATSGTRLFSVTTGSAVTALALDAGDRLLAIGCADGTIHIHDLRERDPVGQWTGHSGPLRALVFGPGGSLAAADDTGGIRVRSADPRGAPPGEVQSLAVGTHSNPVRALDFNRLGELLSADGDGLVRAWRLPLLH